MSYNEELCKERHKNIDEQIAKIDSKLDCISNRIFFVLLSIAGYLATQMIEMIIQTAQAAFK